MECIRNWLNSVKVYGKIKNKCKIANQQCDLVAFETKKQSKLLRVLMLKTWTKKGGF